MDFNVFVSYSTHDMAHVEQIKSTLGKTPIKVFVADHAIPAGEDLPSQISSAIANCDLFVLLWSKNAKKSDWVSQEVGKAQAHGKKIVPIVFDPKLPPAGFVKDIKHIRFYEDPESAFRQLEEIAIDTYNFKRSQYEIAEQKKRDSDQLVKVGIGALIFWLIARA
jgi:hypothetical protein